MNTKYAGWWTTVESKENGDGWKDQGVAEESDHLGWAHEWEAECSQYKRGTRELDGRMMEIWMTFNGWATGIRMLSQTNREERLGGTSRDKQKTKQKKSKEAERGQWGWSRGWSILECVECWLCDHWIWEDWEHRDYQIGVSGLRPRGSGRAVVDWTFLGD